VGIYLVEKDVNIVKQSVMRLDRLCSKWKAHCRRAQEYLYWFRSTVKLIVTWRGWYSLYSRHL